jgi:RND family efflux transporter MFP subunit
MNFIKKHKVLVIVVSVIILAGAGFIFAQSNNAPKRELHVVSSTTVSQEIRVAGRVEAVEKVDLAVQSGGKVSIVGAKVGDSVVAGQTVIKVNSDDLDVLLRRQRADLDKSKIALAKLEFKTTSEDDLDKAYEDGFNAISNAFIDLPSIVSGIRDILGHSYLSNNVRSRYGSRALEFREDALDAYYVAKNDYDDVLKEYRLANRSSDEEVIDELILATYSMTQRVSDAVKRTNTFVDYVEDRMDDSADNNLVLISDQENIDDYTADTNLHLSELLEIKDIISDSKEGITDEDQDIESLRLDIQQAELDIEDTLVQIERRKIKSPINGVVTDVRVELGETIPANETVVSIISASQFQVNANLPESDIAKVAVGSPAKVVLDAYGSEVVFPAVISLIDPAETIVDGVATYKIKFDFTQPDQRIRSGMTADIVITGEIKEDVLAVPARAIKTKEGKKYVEILENEVVFELEVKTGLRGTNGNVEIIEGLFGGEQVVVS